VDYLDEGLNLGLWRRNEKSASQSEPSEKKMIYEVFREADTPQWKEALAFALPVIGIHSWDEVKPKTERELRAKMKQGGCFPL